MRVPLDAPAGVEVVRRKGREASFLFVLNHGVETIELWLPKPARDLLT